MANVKRKKNPDNITITTMELILQPIDRSRADVKRWWYALQNAEAISYPSRSRLYDLGERAIQDGYLTGVMEKRVSAVLNKKIHYEINGVRVDEMEDYISKDKFRLLQRRLWEKKAWGITGIHALIGPEFDFEVIPRKHIKPEMKLISYEQDGWEGIDYSNAWDIYVVEDVERFGLLSKSIPLIILKSGSLSDLAQYIELYGQPIRKGTYPGDNPELKAELKTAMKESGASFTVLLPEGTNIEIIGDHVTNGTGQAHQILFQTVNNEIAVLWLGNTETTGNDNGGSNAKSQEHSKQQKEINKSDLKDMEDMLSSKQMQFIFKTFGWPVNPDKGRFVYEKEINLDELSTKKDIDLAISGKVPIGDDYWYTTYNIPKPENYAQLKAQMEEERKAKLNPPALPFPGQKQKKKKNNPAPQPLLDHNNDFSWLNKIKMKVLDFFDSGHKS
jgi:hypothetical protein